MLVSRGAVAAESTAHVSVQRGVAVAVATLAPLAAPVHVELTLTTRGATSVLVGVRDASRPNAQPSAHVLARDVALSPAAPFARVLAPPHAAVSFAFERVVVVVADAPCSLAARVVSARASPSDTPFMDIRAELRLYRGALRARTVEPYAAYTARLVDVSDPSATLVAPVVTASSGTVERTTVYTTAAEASLTLASSRDGAVPPCTAVLRFASSSARLTPRVVGATTEFALEFASAPSAVPTLEANGAEFACTALSPGVFSAALPTGTPIGIRRLVVDGESQHFVLVESMVLPAPAQASKAAFIDAVSSSAYVRVRVRLLASDDTPLTVLSAPPLVTVTSIGGAVFDASAAVVAGEVVVTLLEATRVFSVAIPAGAVCSGGAVCPALRASVALAAGTVFGVCVPATIFGNGTTTVAFAARCTFDSGASSVAVDAAVTSIAFTGGFSGTATSVTCSGVTTSGRSQVASARIDGTIAAVYAEVLGTGVALLDASRAVATYADGRVATCPSSSLRATGLRSLVVPAADGVEVLDGALGVSPAVTSVLAIRSGLSCTLAPLALAPGSTYTMQLRNATVAVGGEVVVGVSADVVFGAPTVALVRYGSAASNMGLGADPSTRVVAFDVADARFVRPVDATIRTLYVRAEVAASPVGFVSASAVLVSTDGGTRFVACAAFDSLPLVAQQSLVRGLAGPYFRRVPLVGGVALLGVFVGAAVSASSVVVAVDGLALESSLGQDARLTA